VNEYHFYDILSGFTGRPWSGLRTHIQDKIKSKGNVDTLGAGNIASQQVVRNIQMGDKSVSIENFSGTLNIN